MAKKNNRDRGLYKNIQGIWGVLFFLDKKQIGPRLVGSRQDAFLYMQELKIKHKKGLLNIEDVKVKKQITLKEATELYNKHREADQVNKRSYAALLLMFFREDCRISSITIEAIDNYRSFLAQYRTKRKRLMSASTQRQYLIYLKGIFRFCVRAGHVPKNPIDTLSLPFVNDSRIRFLTSDEEIKLRDNLSDDDFRRIRFSILTGTRAEEQWGLRWDTNINFPANLISLYQTKSKKHRHIPISPECKEILEKQKILNSQWVFPNKVGGKTDHDNFKSRTFQPALEKAGVMNFRWHDLRHTFASRLVMGGVDLRTVQELMGHASLEMTIRYAHLSPQHKQKAVDILSNKSNLQSQPESNEKSNEEIKNENSKITHEITKLPDQAKFDTVENVEIIPEFYI